MGLMFWKKKEEPKAAAKVMPKKDMSKKKAAEDAIRDIINLIEVRNMEESRDINKKIDNSVARELKSKLRALAKKVGKI